LNPYIGELAALGTSLCWTATSTFFAFASRKVGSLVLNRARLVLAVMVLLIAHPLLRVSLPLQAGSERWFWLGLSGIVGLTLGDLFLFQSFIFVGPRLGMLMMSLAPVIAGITAWFFLAESLGAYQILGIAVTLGGVAWVVLEGGSADWRYRKRYRQLSQPEGQQIHKNYWKGILFGVGAAAGQALGLILAKKGLAGDFSPLSATLMRMLAATAAMWFFTFLQRQAGATVQRLVQERRAFPYILAGVLTGPSLGVTLSLLAVQHSPVGVASTLMALPPVFLLPVGYFVFQERFSLGAVIGTLVAITGVGLLFLA
jgi:drug/metabolite transporter (DMT)-like permease